MQNSRNEDSQSQSSVFSELSCYRRILVFSLVLQFVGCIAPGWMFLRFPGIDIHLGLWWRLMCEKKKTCESHTPGDYTLYLTRDGESLVLYQCLVILGMFCCIAAMMSLTYTLRTLSSETPTKGMLCCTAVLSLLLCALTSLVPVAKIGSYNKDLADEMGNSIVEFPYALFLSGIGGAIALEMCRRVWFVFCQKPRRQSQNNSQTVSLSPVSTEDHPSNPEMVTMTTTSTHDNTNSSETTVVHM